MTCILGNCLPLYNKTRVKGAVKVLSEKLYELRKKNDLNQEDVADILGVGRTTYANYEHGSREMDYASLIKLADYYKVSLDYIFGRSDFPINLKCYTDEEIEFMERALKLYNDMKYKYKG
ncbi:helix-turn-helix domain-containing protein [Neobacillus niacini]|uniref:helix-turn-helix domain-containing protein n=1 Tax=Neobacillus niacini TaxID=86668 RepID=UPI003B5862B3